MTRSQKKSFRKTIALLVKLTLLVLLFWGGIQPVFTDLFEEERIEKTTGTTGYKTKVNMPADSLMKKVTVFYRMH